MNNKTKIYWSLHDYCEAKCSYCPKTFWGGDTPKDITMYIDFVKRAVTHYGNLGRSIDWFFSGGEPLNFHDFPEMIKLCKESGGTVDLTTNGGKMWMDWWAIEPHVDKLNLTYHYWQSPNLIKFIIDTFLKKNKNIQLTVPLRPDFFKEDMVRVRDIENEYKVNVHRQVLYNNADAREGMYEYTTRQLRIINGQEIFNEEDYDQKVKDDEEDYKKFIDRFTKKKIKTSSGDAIDEQTSLEIINNEFNEVDSNPSETITANDENIITIENKKEEGPVYTGMICNAGVDVLYINQNGWAKGSECNDRPLSNIWTPKFQFPLAGHKCGMTVCKYPNDWQIVKFT